MLKNTSTGIIKIECVECYEEIELFTCDNELKLQLDPEVLKIMKEHELCFDCFNENYFYCWNCKEWHSYNDVSVEEVKILDNGVEDIVQVCGNCIDYDPEVFYCCEGCGEWLYSPDFPLNEVKEKRYNTIEYYCNSCVEENENIFYCIYHEELEYSTDQLYVYNQGSICWDAYESNYGSCSDCGDVHEIDELIYTDYECYCSSCYESHEAEQGKIKSYHNHKMEYIRDNKILSNDNIITMGVELEVDAGRHGIERGEMSNILYDNSNNFFVYEEDSSVPNGFEIITRPYDLEYYNKEGKQIFINALELLTQNNYISHDAANCGYHIHIGRHGLGNSYQERCNTIRKINIITEYYAPELTILSRRKKEKLNHWAAFGSAGIDRDDITLEKLNYIHENNRGRYSALNLNNEATIEFRIFRGTLKKETFLATMELVYNIVSWCIDNDIESLESLNIKEIFTYKLNEHIENYMISKNIINAEVTA